MCSLPEFDQKPSDMLPDLESSHRLPLWEHAELPSSIGGFADTGDVLVVFVDVFVFDVPPDGVVESFQLTLAIFALDAAFTVHCLSFDSSGDYKGCGENGLEKTHFDDKS